MNLFHLYLVCAFCIAAPNLLRAQIMGSSRLRTFNNPTPETLVEYFGSTVVAMGEDRVLIEASGDNTFSGRGAAYLFGTNGTLLTVFTNPVPGAISFGWAMALAGNDKPLIGAPEMNVAYLFDTNATIITTFTNPTPATCTTFGNAVCALNNEVVAIAADRDSSRNPQNGAVFLFNTNGLLLNTITNPTPNAFFDYFGSTIAKSGNDKIVVGAPGTYVGASSAVGAAYIFNTNGLLHSILTNPAPWEGDSFGSTVASLGEDRVLVGAFDGGTGRVYLFNIDGTLLRTLTSPDPARNEYFGAAPAHAAHFGGALATLGTDLIFVGASEDTPPVLDPISLDRRRTGTAYIFSTNGLLLHTILNPFPRTEDRFGSSLSVMGTNKVLIGAAQKIVSPYRPGAAFLFELTSLPPPTLSIKSLEGGSYVRITWPISYSSVVLEGCKTLNSSGATNDWSQIAPPYSFYEYFTATGVQYLPSVTLATSTNQFFRLRQSIE